MPGDATRRRSLATRLRRARREGFVGRQAEVARFGRMLAGGADTAPVLLLHGPGGIGKTALLDRFAHEADDAGREVVRVDAPTIDVATWTCGSRSPVLLVDDLESAPGVDAWLRDDLLPRLPEDAVVVLAGRDRPAAEWLTDPGWRELVDSHRLRPLGDDEATRLLHGRGVTRRALPALLRFSGGNPLALCLAADDAGGDAHWLPGRRVVRTLLDRVVEPPPDPGHDLALRVCSHAAHTTVDLLRAFLDEESATTAFGWLSGLSYVDPDPHGLHPDDLVRRLVDSDHRWRDPQGYDEVHQTIWRHLGHRALDGHGQLVAASVSDLVHLQRYRFPEHHESGALGALDQLVEADPGDDLEPVVLELAAVALGPEGRKDVELWLSRRPEAFSVYAREPGGPAVAFMAVLEIDGVDADTASADPVVAAAWAHATRAGALSDGEQVEVARFVVPRPRSGHHATGDPRLLRWYDALFRRAGRLTASYVVLDDPRSCVPFMAGLDRDLEAEVVASDALTWGVFAHDWRLVPLAQHLERVLPAVGVVTADQPVRRTMDRATFDEAVRQALRDWHDDDALAANPVADLIASDTPSDQPASVVRDALEAAIASLADDPRLAKAHRAVATTFVRGAVTQEAAASRLGIPFSTYRRHLTKGTALVCDRLWSQHQGG